MPRFIALDGEGLTREDGSHDYTLLAGSTGDCIECWDMGGLATLQCFDWLIRKALDNAGSVFVGFSFGYDINMMLRDLPRSTLKRLHENGSVDWIPSQGKRYWLKFIPNKWFELSQQHWHNNKWVKDGYIKVWDVFGFFQMSFIRALADWKVGAVSQEWIAEMKLKRGNFASDDRKEIKRYCFEECKYLVELCNLLQESLDDAQINCKQYHGAGAIANSLLRTHRATEYILQKPSNEFLWNAILCSYFGGRIETFATGFVNQPVYDYDINSAYPSAIRQLPNLAGASWKRVRQYDADLKYAIWRVSWQLREGKRLAPFPWRNEKGNIYYAAKGEGWYHAPEVRAALDAGLPVTVLDGISCTPADDSMPFSWVEDIYHERQRAKQAGDKREKVLKLGLNSLYGKFAQATSGQGKPGPFQCWYYAGWITSYCRAMLLRAASQAPQSVLAFATDGILCTTPLSLEFGITLGTWEAKTIIDDGLLFVQPGLVISRYESFVRTRGVDRSSIGFDVFMQAWNQYGIQARVKAVDTRFISLGRALQSSVDSESLRKVWRRWVQHETEISFWPSRKNVPLNGEMFMPGDGGIERGFTWLEPRPGWDGLSSPYQKDIDWPEAELEPIDFVDALYISA